MLENTMKDQGQAEALPELTVKAIILGIFLALILAASNAYLGLKAGTTISASIPAAVISMAVLRFFRRSNVLENNIVQTAASAGESLVSGVIYIVPALLVLGFWKNFNYLDCVLMSIAGGGMGVMFSVPLRRILLANPRLPYPEGVAIGNVLRASMNGSIGIKYLVNGGVVGAVVGFAQSGLEVFADSYYKWGSIGSSVVGYGLGFSPALIAAGYIVGVEVCASLFIGTIIATIGMPILSYRYNAAHLLPDKFVDQIGHTDIRYIGLGIMLLGGLVTIIKLLKPLFDGLSTIVKDRHVRQANGVSRTELDLSGKQFTWGFVIFAAVGFWVLKDHMAETLTVAPWHLTLIIGSMFIFAVIASFVFSCLCGYFSGLVGATNNPLSAMVLGSLILGSFLMLALLGKHVDSKAYTSIAALVVIVSTIVSTAAAINSETIQDLKAGQMVGATPWKQQFMLVIGMLAAALVIPAILKLLFDAYGMAGVYPRPGMDPNQTLSAPQSAMMALVVQAVFAHDLPWPLLTTGFIIALLCFAANYWVLHKRGMNIIVLAIGLGVYIPLDSITPMVFGGFVAYLISRRKKILAKLKKFPDENHTELRQQRTLMLACGMVAGCALMGVILAIPFAIYQSTDVLAIVSDKFMPIAAVLSVIASIALCGWMYFTAAHSKVVCEK